MVNHHPLLSLKIDDMKNVDTIDPTDAIKTQSS